jgi:ribosomal protein L12E/L44/L45/RPP1/RPP2
MSGGIAALWRYAPDDVLRRTTVVIWVRELKAAGKYLERMLVLGDGEGAQGGGVVSGVGPKLGELRTYSYSGGTLQGHEHLSTEARQAVWVCFVPTATRADKGNRVIGFAKLVACEPTGWTTWAEAARHAGSGVSHAEAAQRDSVHTIKTGDQLYLWRLDASSVTRCTPFRVQRAFSATPGPIPLHLSAKQLVDELPDALLDEMVLTVVPYALTAKRARAQADPAPASPLGLRPSQQSEEGEEESEEEGEEEREEEGEGVGEGVGEGDGDGDGDGERTTPPPKKRKKRQGRQITSKLYTPVQRKPIWVKLFRAQQNWNKTHPRNEWRPVPRMRWNQWVLRTAKSKFL